jgi:hypothetical protein
VVAAVELRMGLVQLPVVLVVAVMVVNQLQRELLTQAVVAAAENIRA